MLVLYCVEAFERAFCRASDTWSKLLVLIHYASHDREYDILCVYIRTCRCCSWTRERDWNSVSCRCKGDSYSLVSSFSCDSTLAAAATGSDAGDGCAFVFLVFLFSGDLNLNGSTPRSFGTRGASETGWAQGLDREWFIEGSAWDLY